jgi:hypothetical protein
MVTSSHEPPIKLAPSEEEVDRYSADLDVGGAPSQVDIVLTTRRLIILPAFQAPRPSPHDLAGPLSVSLAGVGCFDEQCEVVVLSADGFLRLHFATRRRALAFKFIVNGAVDNLPR